MAIFDVCVFVFLAVLSTATSEEAINCKSSKCANSCGTLRKSSPNSPSGLYTVYTGKGKAVKVYCEMGLNGGGYTFLTPQALTILSDAELSSWFQDRTTFLLRVRKTDGTQPYAVLRQLPEYSGIPLKLGLSQYTGYNPPVNIYSGTLDKLFLYFGFLPVAQAASKTVQGLMVNGHRLTFVNSDANPNSHFTLFPNFREAQPSTYHVPLPFCNQLFGYFLPNPSQRVMPPQMFFFGETHWGGGGCYKQTNQLHGITGFNIGFK